MPQSALAEAPEPDGEPLESVCWCGHKELFHYGGMMKCLVHGYFHTRCRLCYVHEAKGMGS